MRLARRGRCFSLESSLPGPSAFDLHRQRGTEKCPDQNDDSENADAREARRDRDRADDVAGNEEFETQEDRSAQILAALSVCVVSRMSSERAPEIYDQACRTSD